MKHKELTGKIIECAYKIYKKRLASFVYPVGSRGITGTGRKIVLGRLCLPSEIHDSEERSGFNRGG